MSLPSRLVCTGCGYEAPSNDPTPFRCPAASDDTDHVLRRILDPGALVADVDPHAVFADPTANPFLRYQPLLHSHIIAMHHGMDAMAFSVLIEELDTAVARVDGRGFRSTPLMVADELASAIDLDSSSLWIKDETGNVAGSHKGRHLVGLMLWLEMARRALPSAPDPARQLAIASCGNAALAAAVVARAANRALDVFVPTWADSSVVARLHELRARVIPCPRDGVRAGDPCLQRFHMAVAEGALPFTCQGSENGVVVEGGKTLVWEMVSDLARHGRSLDHLLVQVGGGALGSACFQGLREARDLDVLDRLPAIHTVQPAGSSPLHRAWDAVLDKLLLRHQTETGQASPLLAADLERARFVRDEVSPAMIRQVLQLAARQRAQFMWAWEEEPRSIASGILDDETYDWLCLVEAMLTTGGVPLVVSEEDLSQAHRLAVEHTGIPADPTGTAGLAGLLELRRHDALAADESVALLFTGVER